MGRNINGTFTLLPAYNPVVPGTIIEADWANNTLDDVAAALTDSLSRSGKGSMSAQLKLTDGTKAGPGVAFDSESSSGFYRNAAGDIRFALLGVDMFSITATGVTFFFSSVGITEAYGDNSTKYATTAYADAAVLGGGVAYTITRAAATAGQSSISLVYTPPYVMVFINGVLLTPTQDYVATSGTAITFNTPLALNDEIQILVFTVLSITGANIAGGTAFSMPYQSAPNVTAFIPQGSPGQLLQANGPAAPSWVVPPSADVQVRTDSSVTLPGSLGTIGTAAIKVIVLDSTHDLILISGTTALYAVVYDAATMTFGSPVLVRTANINGYLSAILASTNTVLICSCPAASTGLEMVVLTVAGTVITVNSAVAVTLGSNCNIGQNNNRLTVVGSSFLLDYANSGAVTCLRAITLAGTVPSVGAESTMTGLADTSQIHVLTSTVALTINATAGTLYLTCVTLAGTAITVNTPTTAGITARTGISSRSLSTGRYGIIFQNTTLYAGIINVAGTTITMSASNTTLGVVTPANFGVHAIGNQIIITDGVIVTAATDNAGTVQVGTPTASQGGLMIATTSLTASIADTTTSGKVYTYGISGVNPVLQAINHTSSAYETTATARYEQFINWLGGAGLNSLFLAASGKTASVLSASQVPYAIVFDGRDADRCFNYLAPGSRCHTSDDILWTAINLSGTVVRLQKVQLT